MNLNQQLTTRLLEIYDQCDSAVDRIRQSYPELVPCRAGCTDCCHAVFDISVAEAAFLAERFKKMARALRRQAQKRAQKALNAWEREMRSGRPLALARIKCPLLSPDNLCLCYEARPVNCRTYGIPTAFNGQSHVCGLTGFKKGTTYTTLNLEPVQSALYELSRRLAPDPVGAARRLPIAAVILNADEISGLLRI